MNATTAGTAPAPAGAPADTTTEHATTGPTTWKKWLVWGGTAIGGLLVIWVIAAFSSSARAASPVRGEPLTLDEEWGTGTNVTAFHRSLKSSAQGQQEIELKKLERPSFWLPPRIFSTPQPAPAPAAATPTPPVTNWVTTVVTQRMEIVQTNWVHHVAPPAQHHQSIIIQVAGASANATATNTNNNVATANTTVNVRRSRPVIYRDPPVVVIQDSPCRRMGGVPPPEPDHAIDTWVSLTGRW